MAVSTSWDKIAKQLNPETGYRKFKLPKKSGGYRTVYAPSRVLLARQREALPDLEKSYRMLEKKLGLGKISHGFLKGRSPVTGARRHIGYDATIMMDIVNFFDNVSYEIVDDALKLVLPIHNLSRDNICMIDGYLVQGFATSPILATIALTPALKTMKIALGKYDARLTVYADDIQVSINGLTHEIKADVERIVVDSLKPLGLEINPKKTRIRHAKFGYRRILGVNVGDTDVRGTRATMRKIRAAKHQGNYRSQGGLQNWANCPIPKSGDKELKETGEPGFIPGSLSDLQSKHFATEILADWKHITI